MLILVALSLIRNETHPQLENALKEELMENYGITEPIDDNTLNSLFNNELPIPQNGIDESSSFDYKKPTAFPPTMYSGQPSFISKNPFSLSHHFNKPQVDLSTVYSGSAQMPRIYKPPTEEQMIKFREMDQQIRNFAKNPEFESLVPKIGMPSPLPSKFQFW